MSNEIVVIQQESLFVTVAGRRIKAFPDTGTILTMEDISPGMLIKYGLHGTAVPVITRADYRLTINVLPGSSDDTHLNQISSEIRRLGRPAQITVTHRGTKYVSGGCILKTQTTRNFDACASYVFGGMFQIAFIGSFSNPGVMTLDDV